MTNVAAVGNFAVRRLSAQAYGLATALVTNSYDPAGTGVPAATASADTIRLIDTVASGHMVWARPADVSRTAVVNGASLAAWINGGSNVLADGSLVNHGRVAYDYSTLIYQNVQEALLDAMAGKEPARSCRSTR